MTWVWVNDDWISIFGCTVSLIEHLGNCSDLNAAWVGQYLCLDVSLTVVIALLHTDEWNSHENVTFVVTSEDSDWSFCNDSPTRWSLSA